MPGLSAFEGHLPYQKYQQPPILVRLDFFMVKLLVKFEKIDVIVQLEIKIEAFCVCVCLEKTLIRRVLFILQ